MIPNGPLALIEAISAVHIQGGVDSIHSVGRISNPSVEIASSAPLEQREFVGGVSTSFTSRDAPDRRNLSAFDVHRSVRRLTVPFSGRRRLARIMPKHNS